MNESRSFSLWLQSMRLRVLHEWQRLGSFRAVWCRAREIWQAEGGRGLSRRIAHLIRRGSNRHPARGAAIQPGINLIGHSQLINGVGENLRAIAVALRAAERPFLIRDVLGQDQVLNPLLQTAPESSRTDHDQDYSTNLFCINANEMDLALSYLGSSQFAGHYNIGCWMWELSVFPQAWVSNFSYVQEIWAQSRFVQASIAEKSPVPVIWMPQVVEPGPANTALGYALGVPPGVFSFLFLFDFNSYVARKNPEAVIEAFCNAFPPERHEAVALVIKVHGGSQKPSEYVNFTRALQDRDARIILIDAALSDQQMRGLISSCHAFVSLHRSEGFGRGLAEAMYYGKPTIATAYSGNMDFTSAETSGLINYQLVPVQPGQYPHWQGQHWAEPDTAHAAHWMRKLYENQDLCHLLGAHAARAIRTSHGAVAVGQRMRFRLKEIGCI